MSKKNKDNPVYRHTFNTTGLTTIEDNPSYDSTLCEVEHTCSLQQVDGDYSINFQSLRGIVSEGNQKRTFVFSRPLYPTDAYTQASCSTFQDILHRFGQVCASGSNFFHCFFVTIGPIPNAKKGIRIYLKHINKDNDNEKKDKKKGKKTREYIDVTNKYDILKCTLAIHAAQIIILVGACSFKKLLYWIKNTITVNSEAAHVNFPIFRNIEQLALKLFENVAAAKMDNSVYAYYVHNICTQYIQSYHQYLAAVEEEKQEKHKKETSYKYRIKLRELQRMMVGTLRHLTFYDKSDYESLENEWINQIQIPNVDVKELRAYLNNTISIKKLHCTSPIIQYPKPECIDNLEEFCEHCQKHNIMLTPDKELQKTLTKHPNTLHVINNIILDQTFKPLQAPLQRYTLQEINTLKQMQQNFLTRLKDDLLIFAQHLCGYLHIKKWNKFDDIDHDALRTGFANINSKNKDILLDKLYCNKELLPHYLQYFQFVCDSAKRGYLRIPSHPDCDFPLPQIDLIKEIEALPKVYKQNMSLLSKQRLHTLLYLLTLNKEL